MLKGVRPMSLQPIDLDQDASKYLGAPEGGPSKIMKEQESQNSQLEIMHICE